MIFIDKGTLLKTVGWITVGVGFYIIAIGNGYSAESFFDGRMKPDNIIDADFKILD